MSCDNDLSFRGEFGEHVRERGWEFSKSIPNRPACNTLAEGWHWPLEQEVRAIMAHCNAPYGFWSYAAVYACHVHARQPDARSAEDGRTPYERFYGAPDRHWQAVPFGCQAHFLREKGEAEKFQTEVNVTFKALMHKTAMRPDIISCVSDDDRPAPRRRPPSADSALDRDPFHLGSSSSESEPSSSSGRISPIPPGRDKSRRARGPELRLA